MTRMPKTTPTKRRLESVAEAAGRVGVHPRTIRRYITAGRLTGYRVGPRLVKVDPDEVDEKVIRPIPTGGH